MTTPPKRSGIDPEVLASEFASLSTSDQRSIAASVMGGVDNLEEAIRVLQLELEAATKREAEHGGPLPAKGMEDWFNHIYKGAPAPAGTIPPPSFGAPEMVKELCERAAVVPAEAEVKGPKV